MEVLDDKDTLRDKVINTINLVNIKNNYNKMDTNNNIDMNTVKASAEDYENKVIAFNIIKTKDLRKNLDEQLQECKKLANSREVSLAITKLQEAIMWLGMNLKALGEINPYPNSKNPENTIVDKTSDNIKL